MSKPLSLQGVEFARKGNRNCTERKILHFAKIDHFSTFLSLQIQFLAKQGNLWCLLILCRPTPLLASSNRTRTRTSTRLHSTKWTFPMSCVSLLNELLSDTLSTPSLSVFVTIKTMCSAPFTDEIRIAVHYIEWLVFFYNSYFSYFLLQGRVQAQCCPVCKLGGYRDRRL